MAIVTNKVQQQAAELSSQLWSICNDLRGGMDANEFRNYILGTIFYRYLSERTEMYMQDILQEDGLSYEEAFTNPDFKPIVEKWSIEHLGYIIRPENLFRVLYQRIIRPKNDQDKFSIEDYERAVNELTGSTLGQKSEKAFEGLFNDMRLQDTRLGDTVSERTDKISKVIAKIGEIDMDLQDQQFDVLGTAYMILIGLFQSGAGKKSGEFFTPVGPSTLCARLASIGLDEEKTVGDCTCGSASMLLDIRKHLTTGKIGHYYGQENNPTTYNLARMNMLMHGIDYQQFDINKGDTLTNDTYGDELKLTVQVCNPPYSLKWDSNPKYLEDPRYSGVGKLAPKSHADLAFVQHMVYHMDEQDGRVAVLLPHGVLFRGGAEEDIRKYLIKDLNRVDAIIGLPENLFHGAGLSVVVLVLKSNRNGNSGNILFIDASKEFELGKTQNELTDENIQKIVETYKKRVDVERFAHVATMDEIIANGFNLNIARYVNATEEKDTINMDFLMKELEACDPALRDIEQKVVSSITGSRIPFDISKSRTIKMKDFFDSISDKNHPEDIVLTIIQGRGTVPREESGRKINYNKSTVSTYKRVLENDFIMHLRSFEGGLELATMSGIVSPAYTILRARYPIEPLFYKQYFRSEAFISGKLSELTEGIRDGKSINMEGFWNIDVPYPSLEEQSLIANQMKNVDALLSLMNEKTTIVETLKKGLLQQLFA